MASNARRAVHSTSTTPRRVPAAIGCLILLFIVSAMLVWSGCGATTQTTPNSGAAPIPVDPSLFVFLHGTNASFQTVDDGVHWTQPGAFTLPGATSHLTFALSSTVRWDAVSTTKGTSSIVTVAHTNDDGRTWHSVALPTFAQPYARPVALQFLDATHGWLEVDVSQSSARRGFLFSTQDGGTTWTSTPLPFGGFISFTSPTVGWLIGSQWMTVADEILARTSDGGKTWTPQTLPLPEGILPVLTVMGQPIFFDPQNGIVSVNIRQSIIIYATHNGGTSWTQTAILENAAGDFQAQPFSSRFGRSAWVVVGRSLFVTHDAGATWETVKHDADLVGAALVVQSDTNAYALTGKGYCASGKSTGECADERTIQGTTDGGHTWETIWTYVYRHP